jgi:hypothetical protein
MAKALAAALEESIVEVAPIAPAPPVSFKKRLDVNAIYAGLIVAIASLLCFGIYFLSNVRRRPTPTPRPPTPVVILFSPTPVEEVEPTKTSSYALS